MYRKFCDACGKEITMRPVVVIGGKKFFMGQYWEAVDLEDCESSPDLCEHCLVTALKTLTYVPEEEDE